MTLKVGSSLGQSPFLFSFSSFFFFFVSSDHCNMYSPKNSNDETTLKFNHNKKRIVRDVASLSLYRNHSICEQVEQLIIK